MDPLLSESLTILLDSYNRLISHGFQGSLVSQLSQEFVSHPLVASVLVMLAVSFYCWIGSLITGNCSQVDRLWSIVPVVYVAIFARVEILSVLKNWEDPNVDWRLIIAFAVSLLWGLRLSFNFWRKGGYTHEGEDYRWPVLRQMMHPILFQIFNITFIALYQNILLLLFTLPVQLCYMHKRPLNELDAVAAGLFLFFLVIETIADEQQWRFQTEKYRRINAKIKLEAPYSKGFITSGLFRYSRHPNFISEMSMWWAFYLFSVAATGVWLNWSIIGTILLTLLFQGSTKFTESITAKKYPEYKVYQQTTSRLIPWFPSAEPKPKKQ